MRCGGLLVMLFPRLERGDMEQECWCVDNPMSFKTASEDGKIFVAAPLCNPLHRNFVRWFWRSGAASVVDRDIATDQLVIGKCGYLLSGGRLVRNPGEIIIFIATKACTRVECEHSSGRIFDIPLRPREAVMCMGNGMRVVEGAGIFCVLGWDYNWNVTSKCKVTCLEVRARIKGTPFDMDNGGFSVIACPRCHRPNGLLVEPKELSRRRWINNVGKCLLVCVYSSEGERAIEKLGRDLEWYGPEYDRLLAGATYREESSRPREPAARDLTLPEGRVSRRCFNSDRYGTDCYTAVEALDIDGYDTEIIGEIEVVPSVCADGGFMIFEPKKWQSKWLKDILTQAEHPAQQRWSRPLKGLLVSFWKVVYGKVQTAALIEAPLSGPPTEGNQAAQQQQQQQQPTGLGPTFNVTNNTGIPKGPAATTWFPAAGAAVNTTGPGRPSPSDVAWDTIRVPVASNVTTVLLPVDVGTTQLVATTAPPVIVPGNATINTTSTTTVEVPVVVPTASAIPVGKRDVYLANGFFFPGRAVGSIPTRRPILETSIYVFACSCLLGTAFAFVSSLVYKFFPRDIGGSNGGYELESRRVASDEVERARYERGDQERTAGYGYSVVLEASVLVLFVYGQLPMLETSEGDRLVQTGAIIRYIARKFDLYGEAEGKEERVDKIIDASSDAMGSGLLKAPFLVRDGMTFSASEKQMGAGKFIAGTSQPTVADSCALRVVEDCVEYFGVEDVLGDLPNLRASRDKFLNVPAMAAFMKSSSRIPSPKVEETSGLYSREVGNALGWKEPY
uniref:Beta-catenin-like protein 1 n=2 Tax=Perkinsus olseni TaxID=32597 RepID=A0A7J6PDK9_PEROL|nr:Beta-catenin-like protein 1 [Perkinsus olseni]